MPEHVDASDALLSLEAAAVINSRSLTVGRHPDVCTAIADTSAWIQALATPLDSRSKPTVSALTAVRAFESTRGAQMWERLSPLQPVPWSKSFDLDHVDPEVWAQQLTGRPEPPASALNDVRSKLVPSAMPHFSNGWITHRTFTPFDGEHFRGSLCPTDAAVMRKFHEATKRCTTAKGKTKRQRCVLQPRGEKSKIRAKKADRKRCAKARYKVNLRFVSTYNGYVFGPPQVHTQRRKARQRAKADEHKLDAQTPLLFPVKDVVSLSIMTFALRRGYVRLLDNESIPEAKLCAKAAKCFLQQHWLTMLYKGQPEYRAFGQELESLSNLDEERIAQNVQRARDQLVLLTKDDAAVLHECACLFAGCDKEWREQSSAAVQYVAATAIRWQLLMKYAVCKPSTEGIAVSEHKLIADELTKVQMDILLRCSQADDNKPSRWADTINKLRDV
jgi:hypothetical protein